VKPSSWQEGKINKKGQGDDPENPTPPLYTTNLTRLSENLSSNSSRFMNLSRSPAASNPGS